MSRIKYAKTSGYIDNALWMLHSHFSPTTNLCNIKFQIRGEDLEISVRKSHLRECHHRLEVPRQLVHPKKCQIIGLEEYIWNTQYTFWVADTDWQTGMEKTIENVSRFFVFVM